MKTARIKTAQLTAIAGMAIICCAWTAKADPWWIGAGSTGEWGESANWQNANENTTFWIDPGLNAPHFNMTFSRDDYDIGTVIIRGMTADQIVTWTGDGDGLGPTVKSMLYVGHELNRGALAIKGGKVAVGDNVRLGQGGSNVGTIVVDGGTFSVGNATYMATLGTGTRSTLALNGGVFKTINNAFNWTMNYNYMETPSATALVMGNGTSAFHLNGGTIQSASDNQSYPLDGATFSEKGLSYDTAGYNATLLQTVNGTAVPGATALTKTGEGMLAVDAPVAGAATKVESGTLYLATDGTRELAHRWSFAGDATDTGTSLNKQPAAAVARDGGTVAYSGGKLVLSATAVESSGLDLGANLLESDAATIEIWATVNTSSAWNSLFSFGSTATGGDWHGMQYWFQGGQGGLFWMFNATFNPGQKWATDTAVDAGVPFVYTVTFTPDGLGGTHVRLCRWNAGTAELLNGYDFRASDWLLTRLQQDCFRLGLSFWNDSPANSEYDEVRIWKGVFTDSELKEHVLLGPDALPGGNAKNSALAATASDEVKANDYLLHRWTFNGTLKDSVSGDAAELKGVGAGYNSTGDSVKLAGGARGTGWVDLGEGASIPVDNTPFTIELWTTPREYAAYTRIFSFGRQWDGADQSSENWQDEARALQYGIEAVYSNGNDAGFWWRFYSRNEGAMQEVFWEGDRLENTAPNWFAKDCEYHVAVTFVPDAATGNTAWYAYAANALTGELCTMAQGTWSGWLPSCLEGHYTKMCNWLGHSQYVDADPAAEYNEVRIWNCALSQAQLDINRKLGPDRLPRIAQAGRDRSFSLEVAGGAVADLGGNAVTLTSLSGSGTVRNGTVTVDGEVYPGGDGTPGTLSLTGNAAFTGTIDLDVGDSIAVDGSLDLSGVTVYLVGDWSASCTVFTAAGGITGTPTLAAASRYYDVQLLNGGKSMRLVRRGFMIVVR